MNKISAFVGFIVTLALAYGINSVVPLPCGIILPAVLMGAVAGFVVGK